MPSAAALSQSLRYSRSRHVAGIPWTKFLTYAAWIALMLLPVGIMTYDAIIRARAVAQFEAQDAQLAAEEAAAMQEIRQAEASR